MWTSDSPEGLEAIVVQLFVAQFIVIYYSNKLNTLKFG